MKLFFGLLLAAGILFAQVPGTVTVSTSITAKAGADTDSDQIICAGTPSATASVMHMTCTVGGSQIFNSDTNIAPTTGISFSIVKGANNITWLLTKGTPDSWQVSANGTVKSGSF
jgi:hypothetical protein